MALDPVLVIEIAVALLVIAGAWFAASHFGKIGVRAERGHTHNWQHVATEWVAGKEVHVMVCWQHPEPMTERQEVG